MDTLRKHLLAGQVIPAHPLALTEKRGLDERRQRALTRYYVAAGVGGLAVGVHTTQFAIREHRLLEPVLSLAAETVRARVNGAQPFAMIAGAMGRTKQAVSEAALARDLGYDAVLLGLGAWANDADDGVLAHCREVADVLPLVGFYLQPVVGGRPLGYAFWRAFAEIPNVVAVKIAPFDRYRTIDVVRAIAAAREDVALYTGNDDNIVADLLTPFPVDTPQGRRMRHIDGGLLGQWAVWTRRAVELLAEIRRVRERPMHPEALLMTGAALTDANGALFDAHNRFAGSIAGIHEVLRRQGLLEGTWCLDPDECLSPGQRDEIDRVMRSYPELADDEFVGRNLRDWLKD